MRLLPRNTRLAAITQNKILKVLSPTDRLRTTDKAFLFYPLVFLYLLGLRLCERFPPRRGFALALAIAFLLPLPAHAQYQLPKNVFGNGGGAASSSSHLVVGTFGQALIGVMQSSANGKYVGFWYLGGIASNNTLPLVENVSASFQGQTILPLGNDLAKVLEDFPTPVTIHVTARDPDPGDAVKKIAFGLEGKILHVDSTAADGWTWPDLDLGPLPFTSDQGPSLMVTAFDSRNLSSLPAFRSFKIIAQPCWLKEHPEAFTFQEERYKFDLRFPKPIYGLDETIKSGVFLVGGKRIAFGLDFNMKWEHSILTHQDLKESLTGYFNAILFSAKLLEYAGPGTLVIDEEFAIEQAQAKFMIDTGWHDLYFIGFKFGIPKIAQVKVGVSLEGKVALVVDLGLDSCLELIGRKSQIYPVFSVRGGAVATIEVLFGIASAAVRAGPGVDIWIIPPNTDLASWRMGGQVWLNWEASGRLFWIFKFKKSGTIGPEQFGDPRPGQEMIFETGFTQLQSNLPEVAAKPAVASDSSGNLLLVWMKDLEPMEGLAIPQIQLAHWNSQQGFTRLAPLTIGDNFDSDPGIAMDRSGNAMVVWTRNKLAITDTARAFEEVLANSEIASMFYEARSKSWSAATLITNDELADGLADIAMSDHSALCVWTHTKDNDLETRGDWEIRASVRQNNAWSAPALLTNNSAADYNVKVAMEQAGRGLAVWTHDADAQDSTVHDIDIQYAVWNGSNWLPPANLTKTGNEEHHPAVSFDATGAAYAAWIEREVLSDNAIVERLLFSKGEVQQVAWSAPEIVFADSLLLEEPALKITTRAGKEIAMLSWRGEDDTDGDMFLSLKNLTSNSPWTVPTQVSQDTLVDWMSAAVFDSRNNAMILSVKTDLNNPATDNSKLGNFGDGIEYFTTGTRSNLQLAGAVNMVGGYLGDVTGEGKVTALDALVLETYRLGLLQRSDYLERIALGFGDVNFDGAANAQDVRFILQHAVEETVPHPVGKWIWF